MLLRTADNLYWMARHMERAENTARLLNAQYQFSLLPKEQRSVSYQWGKVLELFELKDIYKGIEKNISPHKVVEFMTIEQSNPSSVVNSMWNARESARSMRGVIPTDLWEMINSSWLEFENIFSENIRLRDLEKSLRWVTEKSYSFRGVLEATMPRNEFLFFTKIGMYFERADNTARILDISFDMMRDESYFSKEELSPREDVVLNDLEMISSNQANKNFYFWVTVLRSLSAFEIYRQVFNDKISPAKVAELLISRKDFPRSLLVCLQGLQKHLQRVSTSDKHLSNRLVTKISAEVFYQTINEEFVACIRDFLSQFLHNIDYLGNVLSKEFLIPMVSGDSGNQTLIRTIDE
mgnify:CR=1 FL=1|jgi:uncharacterized alpha-E superfamily protein